jgi:hypothetical protein
LIRDTIFNPYRFSMFAKRNFELMKPIFCFRCLNPITAHESLMPTSLLIKYCSFPPSTERRVPLMQRHGIMLSARLPASRAIPRFDQLAMSSHHRKSFRIQVLSPTINISSTRPRIFSRSQHANNREEHNLKLKQPPNHHISKYADTKATTASINLLSFKALKAD